MLLARALRICVRGRACRRVRIGSRNGYLREDHEDGARILTDALNAFDADVKQTRFPALEETYR